MTPERGEVVDIFGPYSMSLGADPNSPSPSTYVPQQGTSISSPFVAGVAALIWAANPNLTGPEVFALMKKYASGPLLQMQRRVRAFGAVREALLMNGKSYTPAGVDHHPRRRGRGRRRAGLPHPAERGRL